MTPSIDMTTITTAAQLKARVAQALRAARQEARARQWEAETACNDHLNGLVIKARAFVVVGSSLPAG